MAALLALAAMPAAAQTIVTSAAPDRVGVTIYREPGRVSSYAFNPDWMGGYALISEVRRVAIPAGESEIRFEGVAGGILPQSAIVTGLPDGIVERNRDAYLLSPESLLDRSLGRRLHLRRTSLETGAVREQDAVVRTGADGAVVLQTAEGFETLRCTGLPETLTYDGVPQGLAARPTLSVRIRASQPVAAIVTLSYLASGFDWNANYIATLSPDGGHVDLFAWLVLGSDDETSFVDAETQAVAGRLNRQEVNVEIPAASPLRLRCWPQRRTHQIPLWEPPEPNLTTVSPITVVNSEEIRLLGTTRTEDLINSLPQSFAARQEELGDLKLYRIPEPVTVAAHSQKQVSFLQQAGVPVRFVYRQTIYAGDPMEPNAASRVLLATNRPEAGLGMPLPGGPLQLFLEGGGRPILLGEGGVRDAAVGEEVEVVVGDVPGLATRVELTADNRAHDRQDFVLTVTNDGAAPRPYEAHILLDDNERLRVRGAPLGRRDGQPLWAVTVPANGSATLRYRVVTRHAD